MSATTIKLESDLLKKIRKAKPAEQSITSFVREVLEGDIRRRQMRDAAESYHAFLESNPDERREMDEWEAAPLAVPPPEPRKK